MAPLATRLIAEKMENRPKPTRRKPMKTILSSALTLMAAAAATTLQAADEVKLQLNVS